MGTRRAHQPVQSTHNTSQIHVTSQANGAGGDYYDASPPIQKSSLMLSRDPSDINKSFVEYNGSQYQLMPVEIEKEAELGLVIGQIEGEQWIFIDEVLPNGMIDMHGILKEGDYIIQAGVYSLVGIDVSTALIAIERAYDEGKKTVSFVAARQQKADSTKISGRQNQAQEKSVRSNGKVDTDDTRL